MEHVKLRYLQKLCRQRNEDSVDKYVKAMREVEEKARGCYAEHISLSKDGFVEMLVIDGCFIIEWIRKYVRREPKDPYDIFFPRSTLLFAIWRDLMLVENQLPFFVLTKLFDMTKSEDQNENIIDAAVRFVTDFQTWEAEKNFYKHVDIGDLKHLVDLVHKCWCSPFDKIISEKYPIQAETNPKSNFLVDLVHKCWCSPFVEKLSKKYTIQAATNPKSNFIRSATELKQAGVKFEKVEETTLFNISFLNGVMKIPRFSVKDETEFFARNLVAYEQYLPDGNPTYVTNYFTFIDCLVNSSKDVEILREADIIDSWMGDNETVVTMLNKISNDAIISMNRYYMEIFCLVNKYCNKRVNIWVANLKQNYFNNPWALISVLAAAVLLLLAFVQTIFSIIK
ncbi:hypothetical protein NMG60_11029621 [Bertholletia excelsa]